jgi:putative transposase
LNVALANDDIAAELLDGEILYTLKKAQIIVESWRRHCDAVSPHASIGDKSPASEVFAPAFAAWLATQSRPVPPTTLAPRSWRREQPPAGTWLQV